MSVGNLSFGGFRAPVETSSSVDGTATLKVRMARAGESRNERGDDSGSPMHVEVEGSSSLSTTEGDAESWCERACVGQRRICLRRTALALFPAVGNADG